MFTWNQYCIINTWYLIAPSRSCCTSRNFSNTIFFNKRLRNNCRNTFETWVYLVLVRINWEFPEKLILVTSFKVDKKRLQEMSSVTENNKIFPAIHKVSKSSFCHCQHSPVVCFSKKNLGKNFFLWNFFLAN